MIFPVESEAPYTKPHVTGAVYAESPQIRGHTHPMIHLNQALLPDSGAAPARSHFLPALFSVADTAGAHSTLGALLWGLQPADAAGTHSTLGALLWGLQPADADGTRSTLGALLWGLQPQPHTVSNHNSIWSGPV